MLPEYPFATPPAAGATCEVAAGVHWLRMPLPFALNHINLWLLEDDHGWTIVDTGFALDTVKDCWQTILARLSETTRGGHISRIMRGGHISRIIVTHFHPDHLGLAAWLQEMTGAPIHMTLGEYLTAHAVWHEIGGHGCFASSARTVSMATAVPPSSVAVAATTVACRRCRPTTAA